MIKKHNVKLVAYGIYFVFLIIIIEWELDYFRLISLSSLYHKYTFANKFFSGPFQLIVSFLNTISAVPVDRTASK